MKIIIMASIMAKWNIKIINEIISIINNENNIINNVEIISIMKENNENGMKIMAYQYNNENAIINNGE
jgi:hypothetical protein